MMRFAALLDDLARERRAVPPGREGVDGAWSRYRVRVGPQEAAVAEALLTGQRPKKVAGLEALVAWAAEAAGVPDWLAADCLAVSGDRAEVAALLMGDGAEEVPSVADVVAILETCGTLGARGALAGLWPRLPVAARVVTNRLASGTFRARLPEERPVPPGAGGVVRAVMIQAAPAAREVMLALWRGNELVPVARLRLDLAEAPEVFAWVRANMQEKFGPVRTVPPLQLFDLSFAGTLPNARRKCGVDLVGARVLAWVGERGHADEVAALAGGGGSAAGPGGVFVPE